MPDDPKGPIYDAQVRQAWTRQKLSDGTMLNLGNVDREQFFAVTLTGTVAVNETQSGWQRCSDGSERRYTITKLTAFGANPGGHTHPIGRMSDIVADIPGPEDGRMATLTKQTAYVISRRRAFAIEQSAPGFFTTRLIAGAKFSKSEQATVARQQVRWSQHGGGSGVQCQFVPD